MKQNTAETEKPARGGRNKIPAQARLAAILERLHTGGSVTVADIARDFNVSDMTVRRDLAELENEGLLERVHGGAVPLAGGPLTLMDDVEPDFGERTEHNRTSKEAIAQEAARIVSRYRTIAMDVGTTTLQVAHYLEGLSRKRVFTNSLRIADALSRSANEVYVPGGRIRPDEMSIIGPIAVEQFSSLYFDVALLGASGLTAEGFYDYSMEEGEMKRIYVERSAVKIVLCDASKFRRMSLICFSALKDISMVITDAPPPPDIAQALAAARVDVRIAGAAG